MEFDYTLSSLPYHRYVCRLMPFPPMAYSKPLNPSAPPFRPVAAPPPPPPALALLQPAFPLWYHPHRYRPLRVGGFGKKLAKRSASHGGGRVRGFVPPRLMFTPKEEEPRWLHGLESKQRWVPKDFKLRDDSSKSEKLTADEEDEDDVADAESAGLRGRTTVMMRNIPNLMKRQDLIEILDEHCHEANANHSRLRSEYDFVYLPIDYAKKANKGYAFVNFTTPEAAVRMWRAFDGLKWEGFRWKCVSYRSKKVCRICPATIQGNAKLEVSFRNRTFPSEEFQPVAAAAIPRDGMNGAPLSLVGKPTST